MNNTITTASGIPVTGNATVTNGIVSLIPSCSDVSYADISASRAARYNITTTDYIKDELVPTMIPGLVFGGLALVAAALMLAWLCVAWCRHCCRGGCCRGGCCRRQGKHQAQAAQQQAQFITTFPPAVPLAFEQGSDGATVRPAGRRRSQRRTQAALLFKLLLAAMTLAVVGTSIWGLVESIQSTNSTVSNFWDVVDQVDAKADNAISDLTILADQLNSLNADVVIIVDKASVIQRLLRLLRIPPDIIRQVMDTISSLPGMLSDLVASVEDGKATLQDNIQQTIHDIRDDWQDVTMSIQDTWRFLPICILLGLNILFAALCGLLCWRLSWYRTATFFTFLFWLNVALLMLLGAGLLRGVFVGASDSCKYVETLLMDLAYRKITNAKRREEVTTALAYYFGITYIPDALVIDELLGVPTWKLHQVVEGPLGTAALPVLSSPTLATAARTAGFSAQEVAALSNLTVLIPAISVTGAVSHLEEQALFRSIHPVYYSAKEYICCTLNNEAWDVWVAWTVVGCLSFVLALMCSGRIVQHALERRRHKAQMPAAQAAGVEHPQAVAVAGLPPAGPDEDSANGAGHMAAGTAWGNGVALQGARVRLADEPPTRTARGREL